MTAALPDNTPVPALLDGMPAATTAAQRYAVAAHVAVGYFYTTTAYSPQDGRPIARMALQGPRWLVWFVALVWLVFYGLALVPWAPVRRVGIAAQAYGIARRPIIYIDADGVAN